MAFDLKLFPVARTVPNGRAELVRLDGGQTTYRECVEAITIPSFWLRIGPLWTCAAWGVSICWGVLETVQPFEAYRRYWQFRIVDYRDLVSWPWLWWSPIKPVWMHGLSGRAQAWTGRDREICGFSVRWGRHSRIHWLKATI